MWRSAPLFAAGAAAYTAFQRPPTVWCRSPSSGPYKSDDDYLQDSMFVGLFRKLFKQIPKVSSDDVTQLSAYAIPVVLAFWGITYIVQKRAFNARNLTNRVNFSLNTLLPTGDGKHRLLRRTLREVNVDSLMPLRSGVATLVDAGVCRA